MSDEITRLRRQRDFWIRQAMAFSEHADNMRIALLDAAFPTLCEPDPSVGVAGMDPATDRKSAATCRACAGSCGQPFDSAPITNNDAATGEPGGGVGFSPGSSGGPINRSAERQSPDRECGESQRRDVPQQDNCRAAGGPAHKSMIDVEEVLRELHSLAESGEGSRYEVRRTAATAATAIDLLRAWVNELQWSKVEIDSLQHVVEDGRLVDLSDYGRLRSLLVRLRPEWEGEEDSDRPQPISDERLAALEQLSAMDQELELKYGITGNPMIKAQGSKESAGAGITDAGPRLRQMNDVLEENERLRGRLAWTERERDSLRRSVENLAKYIERLRESIPTKSYVKNDENRGDSPAIRDTAPPRKGTPAEGSVPREGTEPVAWAVMEPDGFGIEGTFTDRSDATEWCDGRQQIVPLYRHPQPTLTDAEREAVRRLACACETSTFLRDPVMASTLRGLLERHRATGSE